METATVQKLARVLRVLVTLAFVCCLLALPLVPGLVGMRWESGSAAALRLEFSGHGPLAQVGLFFAACLQYLSRVWRWQSPAVLTVFLLFCGVCGAAILWQARRVLNTVVAGAPFQAGNAKSLKRAAVCFFAVSAAALVRMVWGFCYYRSLLPLFTYNALFVPVFLMGGLLCMVMSALFRQASELKAENDLTI